MARCQPHPMLVALGKARRDAGLKLVDIAALMGVNYKTVSNWESGRKQPDFIDVVEYCRLMGMPLQFGPGVRVAQPQPRIPRPRAPRQSRSEYDEVRVMRAVGGQRTSLSPRERREAVQTLDRRGFSARQIAERVGITQRSVQRHRSALRQRAVA